MRRTTVLVLLLLAGCVAQSTPPPAAEKTGWTDSYPKALKQAKQENKNIILYFTGSDW